jgi:hypothetical protein
MALRHVAPIVAALAAAQPALAAPRPVDSISKTEVRSDPPEMTNRRLRRLVWNMFQPTDFRGRKPPTQPLSRLWLATKPRATRVPGLCRYDSVRIEFQRLDPRDRGADARTRPVGLESQAYFAFLAPPAGDYNHSAKDPPATAACARLGDDHPTFTADDEEVAADGYLAWLRLQRALRDGKPVPLECDLYAHEKIGCAALILSLPAEHISTVDRCEADFGAECFRVTIDDRAVDVRLTGHVTPGPPAGEVTGAKLGSLIIFADTVID